MFRTLSTKAAGLAAGAVVASALFAFQVTPAQSASITITDNSCSTFTTTGGGTSAVTVTCGVGGGTGAPTGCSVSGPTTASVGSNAVISVGCTGGATLTSWRWTGGSCNGQTTPSCTANESASGQVQYGVTVGNGNAPDATATPWTVTWAVGSVQPSGCTLSPASQTVASGGTATISASCTSGTFPITHTLSSAGAFNNQSAQQPNAQTPAQFQATVTAAVTVSGTASNGGSPVPDQNTAGITISGGGGGGSLANCTSQGYTVVGGGAVTLPFAGSSQGGNSGSSFGDTAAWVFAVSVPAGIGPTGTNGSLIVVENGGQGTPRNVVLSKTPCDFNRSQDYTGANGPIAVCRNGTSCSVNFQVGNPSPFGGTGWMQAGTTYYISARNWSDFPLPNGSPSCGQSSCPAVYNYQPTH